MQFSWPNWLDPSGRTQPPMHCYRGAPPWASAFWRTGLPPLVLRLQLQWFNLQDRLLVIYWQSAIHSMHGRVRLVTLAFLKSPSYVGAIINLIDVGGWGGPLMLKWWWACIGQSTQLCKSKECLGRCAHLWYYFFHQILGCITQLTPMRWWLGEASLCTLPTALVASLCFPIL